MALAHDPAALPRRPAAPCFPPSALRQDSRFAPASASSPCTALQRDAAGAAGRRSPAGSPNHQAAPHRAHTRQTSAPARSWAPRRQAQPRWARKAAKRDFPRKAAQRRKQDFRRLDHNREYIRRWPGSWTVAPAESASAERDSSRAPHTRRAAQESEPGDWRRRSCWRALPTGRFEVVAIHTRADRPRPALPGTRRAKAAETWIGQTRRLPRRGPSEASDNLHQE